MKWFSVALISALALLSNACEQHKASELEHEHGAGGHAAGEHKAQEHPAAEHKAEGAKTEETPKFFPEKK